MVAASTSSETKHIRVMKTAQNRKSLKCTQRVEHSEGAQGFNKRKLQEMEGRNAENIYIRATNKTKPELMDAEEWAINVHLHS